MPLVPVGVQAWLASRCRHGRRGGEGEQQGGGRGGAVAEFGDVAIIVRERKELALEVAEAKLKEEEAKKAEETKEETAAQETKEEEGVEETKG